METIKQRRVKVGDSYLANGYGRGTNKRNVYLIDGYYYAYHPEYAKQSLRELEGELNGYVPVNKGNGGDGFFYYQCGSNREGHGRHIPAV